MVLDTRATAPPPETTATRSVCLNMIVKNEAHVIRRCLESVRDHITTWVICDTGSTDGTQQLIGQCLAGIPGQLVEHEWIGFAENRTRAIGLARRHRVDYILTLDADEVLIVDDPAWLDDLALDVYNIRSEHSGFAWLQTRLLRTDLPWRWLGALHEYPDCGRETTGTTLVGARIWTDGGGARSLDPRKTEKDLQVLEAALDQEPDNARYFFYYGLTLTKLGRFEEALSAFAVRAQLEDGFDEEAWYALYQVAQLHSRAGRYQDAADAYLRAYAACPRYAEPLYWMARSYIQRGLFAAALPLLELASTKRKPDVALFLEDNIYDYQARLYGALCFQALGRADDAAAILNALIESGALPDDALARAAADMMGPDAGQEDG